VRHGVLLPGRWEFVIRTYEADLAVT